MSILYIDEQRKREFKMKIRIDLENGERINIDSLAMILFNPDEYQMIIIDEKDKFREPKIIELDSIDTLKFED
jgi:hypothetical protein